MVLNKRHILLSLAAFVLAAVTVLAYFALVRADVLAASCAAGPIVGEIRIWTTDTPPDCWKLADGSPLDTTAYSDLHSVIQYQFGGSGNTFNLPDLTARFPVGVGNGRSIADTGGAEQVTLTIAQMPEHNHSHTAGDPNNPRSWSTGGGSMGFVNWGTTNWTGNTGGNQPHNNMPPYLTLHYIIFVGK